MGNNTYENESKLESKDRFINYQQLSEENKLFLINIPFIDFTYFCLKCNTIPKIKIEYDKEDGYITKILFEECSQNVNINLNNDNFGLKKRKLIYLSNKSSLPFKTIEDCNEYIRVYKTYLNVRDEIKKYNFGDTRKNQVFSLFEDLLYIGLYGSGTNNEYENSIAIKEFTFEKFKLYL